MSSVGVFFMVLAMSVPAASAVPEGGAPDLDEAGLHAPKTEIQPRTGHLPVHAASRGQMLYENHCLGCHESVLFIREKRTVGSLVLLRNTVLQWAVETKLPWGTEEIDDVTGYLNSAYYRFGLR